MKIGTENQPKGNEVNDQGSSDLVEKLKASMAVLSKAGDFTPRGERFFTDIIEYLEFLEEMCEEARKGRALAHEQYMELLNIISPEPKPNNSKGCQNRRFGHLKVCKP